MWSAGMLECWNAGKKRFREKGTFIENGWQPYSQTQYCSIL
jgi:hypothetical protein